jgi:hypothetical protein
MGFRKFLLRGVESVCGECLSRCFLKRLLRPGPVDFADVLHPAHGANFPPDIVRD